MLKKLIYTTIFSSSLLMYGIAMADSVPVVNAYQYESSDSSNTSSDNGMDSQNTDYVQAPQPHLSTSQRLSRLEQQMSNQQLMDIPGQIQTLQQQIEKLQGQIQLQDHELGKLKLEVASIHKTKPAMADASQADAAAAQQADTTSTTTQAAATPPASGSNFLNDQSTYQAAYNLIAATKYPDAITALNNYLQKFPNGQYASNAYYWLGELYLLQNNDAAATAAFKTVLSQYANSNKYPDAMLKLGLIYYDNGQLIKAKNQLQKVVKLYPNTAVARLASARLLDINQQTNTQTTAAAAAPATTTAAVTTPPATSQDTASITTTSSSN